MQYNTNCLVILRGLGNETGITKFNTQYLIIHSPINAPTA